MTLRAVCVAACVLLLALPAQAQDATVEARRAFSAGEAAFARDDYPTALAEFQRAFELAPRAAVRFNIAVCLERMGRFREAREEYRAAIASGELDEAGRKRAQGDAARMQQKLGTVVVEGEPRQTRVWVDGARICEALPCSAELDPGRHRVVARASGIEKSTDLGIEPGERRIWTISLRAPAPKPRQQPKPQRAPASGTTSGPGVWTWVGGGLVLAGTAGTIGFGLQARSLKQDYDDDPRGETIDDGERAVLLTNVSIGVAVVGAALIAVDLILLAPNRPRTGRALAPVISF